MTTSQILMPFLTFTVGISSYISMKKHILTMVISMEIMMVSIVLLIFMTQSMTNNAQVLLSMMVFMVVESTMALSLITKATKNSGFQSPSM